MDRKKKELSVWAGRGLILCLLFLHLFSTRLPSLFASKLAPHLKNVASGQRPVFSHFILDSPTSFSTHWDHARARWKRATHLVSRYVVTQPTKSPIRASQIQGDWKLFPELPSAAEILQPRRSPLPENPVDTPWATKEAFLETQYRLLRCESTEGLRLSVRSFVEASFRRQELWDDEVTWVYNNVVFP